MIQRRREPDYIAAEVSLGIMESWDIPGIESITTGAAAVESIAGMAASFLPHAARARSPATTSIFFIWSILTKRG